ncbi:MAG: zinc ribbon domain-containing protein [Pyrinomonadaceae bacterium]
MDEKTRCQSCGMPIEGPAENRGTEADGSASSEYCKFCYQNGAFTAPDQTVDGMVQTSIDFMTSSLGFTHDEASQMSNDVIRRLKRWS